MLTKWSLILCPAIVCLLGFLMIRYAIHPSCRCSEETKPAAYQISDTSAVRDLLRMEAEHHLSSLNVRGGILIQLRVLVFTLALGVSTLLVKKEVDNNVRVWAVGILGVLILAVFAYDVYQSSLIGRVADRVRQIAQSLSSSNGVSSAELAARGIYPNIVVSDPCAKLYSLTDPHLEQLVIYLPLTLSWYVIWCYSCIIRYKKI